MLHKKGGAFVSNETQFVIVPPFETEAEPISFCSTCAESELAATLGWSINLLVFMQHTSLFLSSQNDPPPPPLFNSFNPYPPSAPLQPSEIPRLGLRQTQRVCNLIQHECWLNGAFPLLSCQLQLSDFILAAPPLPLAEAGVSAVKGQLQDVPYSSTLTQEGGCWR